MSVVAGGNVGQNRRGDAADRHGGLKPNLTRTGRTVLNKPSPPRSLFLISGYLMDYDLYPVGKAGNITGIR